MHPEKFMLIMLIVAAVLMLIVTIGEKSLGHKIVSAFLFAYSIFLAFYVLLVWGAEW